MGRQTPEPSIVAKASSLSSGTCSPTEIGASPEQEPRPLFQGECPNWKMSVGLPQ